MMVQLWYRYVYTRRYQVPGSWYWYVLFFFWSPFYFYFPASGQAVFSGVVLSSPRYVPSIFIAHRVQRSHCSSIFIECCSLTLSRFPRVNMCTRRSPYEFFTSMHAGGLELTQLAYSRHEDNLLHYTTGALPALVYSCQSDSINH